MSTATQYYMPSRNVDLVDVCIRGLSRALRFGLAICSRTVEDEAAAYRACRSCCKVLCAQRLLHRARFIDVRHCSERHLREGVNVLKKPRTPDRRSELIVRILRGKFQPCMLRSFVSSAHEYCLSCLQRSVFAPVDDHSFRAPGGRRDAKAREHCRSWH
ncbi:hypothetical protein V5799_031964 [Amblyomma americanum]|uniref:Uncharacterized protein n=1 Tax=Amblyomma americanum TaxID=6943 RepID=A0AAQ4DSI7_AMBAM